MKSTFTFYTDTLRANWYRALPEAIRVFWTYLQAESDAAGWWQPDWDVAQAWLKLSTPLNPTQVEAVLLAAGQIRIHPSGFWELTEYQEQQYPRGLSETQSYHRSIRRLLDQHLKRERALAGPERPGPSHRPPLDPNGLQGDGGTVVSGGQGGGQRMDTVSMADACKTQDPGPEPRPEAKGRAQDLDPVPTGGSGGGSVEQDDEPLSYGGQAHAAAMASLDGLLVQHGVGSISETAQKAIQGLLEARGLPGTTKALQAWLRGSKRPTAHGLELWLADGQRDCKHPEPRRWWTAPAPGDAGMLRRHWRCLACGHHEIHGKPFPAAVADAGHESVAA